MPTGCTVVSFTPASAVVAGPITDPSGDTITANQYLNIGTRARFVVLSEGFAVEISTIDGTWVRQREWTLDAASLPAGVGSNIIADTVTAGAYLYLGLNARFVALSNGVAFEVRDAAGTWTRENEWTET